MTELITQGFSVKTEILKIGSIKPGGAGEANGRPYAASTKFKSTNVTEEPFEDSFREVEEIIEFSIPCSSSKEASDVSNLLRNLRVKNLPVFVNSSMPKKYDGSQQFIAKSFEHGLEFIKLNRTHDKKDS